MKRYIAILTTQCLSGIVMTAFPQTRPAGIALLLFAIPWLAAVIAGRRTRRKKLAVLRQKIEAYIQSGKEPSFSLSDDDYAELENSIAELAHLSSIRQETVQTESRSTIDFIADVSHQLKTPLTSLRLYSELQSGPYSEKQLALIDRMEKLVYSLLRLQKLRAGAYELRFMPHELNSVLREVWEELSPLYPGRRLRVSGEPGALRCDEYWLGEAFKNLLKNACEHTAEDGTICVNMTRLEKSILMTVEDNGGGVPDAELPHLFRRFYSPSCRSDGTGLGLAITRAIIEKHHGSVSAENAAEGLRVTLCLPVLEGVLPVPDLEKT